MNGASPLKFAQKTELGGTRVSPGHLKEKSTAPKKKEPNHGKKKHEEADDVKLEDPTSVTLMNSFLIKNAGKDFENYSNQLKLGRRKTFVPNGTMGNSATMGSSSNPYGSPMKREERGSTYGRVMDHRPAARDGHTGVVINGNLLIFGGDRHHMPFNDLFMLCLDQEFIDRGMKKQ
jgi:hypothetical protein